MNTKQSQQPAKVVKLFDTHCHLDFAEFDSDRKKLYTIARQHGLQGMVVPGVKREGWRLIRQLCALMDGVHSALGLHPAHIKHHQESHLHDLELALSVGPLVAVGEIGLDYQQSGTDKTLQEKYFHRQLQIAKDAKLPVILHVNRAHEDVLRQLRILNFQQGGVVHNYSGDLNQAKRYHEHGFKLGVGSAITYLRAIKIRAMVSELPLEQMVLETGAPGLLPATCKGKRNTPVHLFDNFRALCQLRGESASELSRATTENAYTAFRLN